MFGWVRRVMGALGALKKQGTTRSKSRDSELFFVLFILTPVFMTHTSQKHDLTLEENSGHSALFGLAIAGALAAGIGLFLQSERGQEIRAEVSEKAKEVAERFKQKREDLQAKVLDVFGELSDELESSYIEVRGKVLADLHSTKEGVKLTQDKFDEVVEEIVDQFSQKKKWSGKVAKALKTNLKLDWEEIKSQF